MPKNQVTTSNVLWPGQKPWDDQEKPQHPRRPEFSASDTGALIQTWLDSPEMG